MEKNFEDFLNKARSVKMGDADKDRIKSEVFRFVKEYTPHKKNVYGSVPSPFFSFVFRWHAVAYALLIFVFVGTGTSIAASRSVPGNVLYPVKVGINEKIQSVVAVSEESKAEVDARIAEVRLLEAEKLAKDGKLDTETRVKLENAFEKKVESFEKRIKKIESKESEKSKKLEEDFQTKLKNQEAKFTDFIEEEKEDEKKKEEIRPFVEKVRGKMKEREQKREERESKDNFDRREDFEREESTEDVQKD